MPVVRSARDDLDAFLVPVRRIAPQTVHSRALACIGRGQRDAP